MKLIQSKCYLSHIRVLLYVVGYINVVQEAQLRVTLWRFWYSRYYIRTWTAWCHCWIMRLWAL